MMFYRGIMAYTLFFLFFFVVLCIIGYSVVSGIIEWDRNNKSPVISEEVKVADKRKVRHTHHHKHNGHHHVTHSSSYYMTFKSSDGEIKEFRVSRDDYATFDEGEYGTLTYQGTRFLGFERNI